MSHVDEGTIHAWLDGAFGPDDPELMRIEAHLESCAECIAVVEAERRIAERAADVLGHVVPDNLTVEPFEKILAARHGGGGGAVSRATPPRPSYRMPMTLAATVVLAVTATWFAREYLPASAPDAKQSISADMEQDAPAEGFVGGRRLDESAIPSTSTIADAVTPSRNERAASDDRGVAGRASGGAITGATTQAAAERENVERKAASPPAAVVVPPRTAEPPAIQVGESRQRTQEETRGLAESILLRSVATEKTVVFGDIAAGDYASADSAAGKENSTVLALVDTVSWVPSDTDAVAALLGGTAAGIAGMTPDSIQQATVRGVPFARFVYRLADATMVELVQWPMGAIQNELQAADRDRLVAQNRALALDALVVGGDRVDFLLRGLVSPDSLAALRKKVRRSP